MIPPGVSSRVSHESVDFSETLSAAVCHSYVHVPWHGQCGTTMSNEPCHSVFIPQA